MRSCAARRRSGSSSRSRRSRCSSASRRTSAARRHCSPPSAACSAASRLGALALDQARLDQAMRVAPTSNNAAAASLQRSVARRRLGVFSGTVLVDSMPVDVVTARDLGEKLNINQLTENDMRTFFSYLLSDYSKATQLSQAIMDWRDADIHSAAQAARSATPTSRTRMLALPTNAPFREVDDLRDVMGMTPEIYAQASPYLTTRGNGQVNINTAPVPVLRALPGMTDATHQHDPPDSIAGPAHRQCRRGPTQSRLGAARQRWPGSPDRVDRALTTTTASVEFTYHARASDRRRSRVGSRSSFRSQPAKAAEAECRSATSYGEPSARETQSRRHSEEADRHWGRDLADGACAPRTFGCAIAAIAPGARRSIRRRATASGPRSSSALSGSRTHAVGTTEGKLAISLVPPLTEVRRIEFPPVDDEDLQRLLSRGRVALLRRRTRRRRSSARSLAGRRVRGAPTSVIAAAAPARLGRGDPHRGTASRMDDRERRARRRRLGRRRRSRCGPRFARQRLGRSSRTTIAPTSCRSTTDASPACAAFARGATTPR